jgi:hypothetical protein
MKRLLILAPLLLATGAAAQAPADSSAHGGLRTPVTIAHRVAGPIRVDGRLDDAVWSTVEPTTSFTQYDPEEGQPASEQTEVRVVYDDEALYVGIRLHDRGRVSARLGRRDMDLSDSDWFGLVIDSYHDHQSAYSFDVNPSGVRRDATKTDNGDDMSWDAVWEAEATQDSGGWSAEYRIPFSQLRFNPNTDTWGILFERVIGRRNEYSVSAFTPRNERGGIARYGHLSGLRGVPTGRRLEVLPYTVARAEYIDPGANPFRTDREHGVAVGVDLKYRLTTDFTLDATLNPDFGQVEVDPATVNLTAFETIFQEKRPFFVEGAEIFNFAGTTQLPFGGALFYSRRIGGRFSPVGPPTDSADVPRETSILGAAKLSGRTRSGWSLGILNAVTAREESRFRLGADDESLVVEPLTNFLVARVRRDMRGGQTRVGVLGTAVNRDLESPALQAALPSGAYTVGMDFRHEFLRRSWALTGWAAVSSLHGDSLAIRRVQQRSHRYFQRPDADHLELDPSRESLSGFSGEMRLRKQAGAHWRGSVALATINPGFEANELGSQRRGDRVDASLAVTYLQQRPMGIWRRFEIYPEVRREMNYDGDHIYTSLFAGAWGQLRGYWSGNLNFGYSPRSLDDRLTRGGPLAVRPSNWRLNGNLNTDGRKPLVGNTGFYYEEGEFGGWIGEMWAGMTVKRSPRWNLSVSPDFLRVYNPAQYRAALADNTSRGLFGRRYVFAPLSQTQLSVETRLNYTFSPDLALQVYAQPFISAGDFGDSRYLVRPRSYEFAADSVATGDFNIRSLRGNAVLRWEYRPGSTLYLAWQQSRESFAFLGDDIGSLRMGRDRSELFHAQPDNVFVLKVSYWLNP